MGNSQGKAGVVCTDRWSSCCPHVPCVHKSHEAPSCTPINKKHNRAHPHTVCVPHPSCHAMCHTQPNKPSTCPPPALRPLLLLTCTSLAAMSSADVCGPDEKRSMPPSSAASERGGRARDVWVHQPCGWLREAHMEGPPRRVHRPPMRAAVGMQHQTTHRAWELCVDREGMRE